MTYHLAETVSNQSLPRATRHLAEIYLMRVETTNTELIKLASLPGTQVPLCLCVPKLSKAESQVARNIVVSNSSNYVSSSNNNSLVTKTSYSVEYSSTNDFAELEQMENNDRTLKELAILDYPQLELAQTYELKSGLVHLLPKFHGLVGEDPHKYLKEFQMVCSTMRRLHSPWRELQKIGCTYSWLVLFNTLGDMKRMFLEKFFLASRNATIRKEICGIRQHSRETLHEY
ncbi:hypothetical protein CR513_27391, partial [Mucuna pruriens]